MISRKKNLAVFFTYGVSLIEWKRVGNLNRELKPYIELSDEFSKIFLVTYGQSLSAERVGRLPENIFILCNKWKLPNLVYSFLVPFIYYRELRSCSVLKTSQMNGSWAAVLTKIIHKNKLVIRCGYEWYDFAIRDKKSGWKKWLIKNIENFSYSFADSIIITSVSAKKFIEDVFKVDSSKVELIPNYIDTNLFKPEVSSAVSGRIVFVGRFTTQKNIFALIDAVSQLEDVHLILIGSGELNGEITEYTSRLGDRVELLGNIPNENLPAELNKAEVFILPSLYEGNPKTLLEAMSCGKPCVGANVEGISGLINHLDNGFLSDVTTDSIRDTLSIALQDKHLSEKIGKKARDYILDNHSFSSCIAKEKALYDKLYV